MLGPEASGEKFVEEIFGIVLIHFDFLEDDLAFLGDVFGIKFWAEDEIGENVEGDGEMLIEDLGVEADLLLGGESVQHAADGVHFTGDSFSGAALGTFENHVLDEMGEAVFLGNFAAGTIADPNADGDGAHVGHGLRDDDEAVGENLFLNVPCFRGHGKIVTQGEAGGECSSIPEFWECSKVDILSGILTMHREGKAAVIER
jgi:hypothetical protein